MPNIHSLVKTIDQKVLSADQKKYFKLLSEIEKLNAQITKEEDFFDQLLTKYYKYIDPLEKDLALSSKNIALMLNDGFMNYKLSKNAKAQTGEIISLLLKDYLQYFPEDKKSKSLYESWLDNEEIAFEKEMKKKAKDIFRQTVLDNYGLDIDVEDLDIDPSDPESFSKFHAKYSAQFESIKERENEKNTNRKKTKKEIATEKKEKIDNRNLREIYISLAKQLHPDKAKNAEDKNRNEAVMKEITEAYENNDIITLLNLELKYITYTSDDFLKLDKSKIKSFINLLSDQKNDLKEKIEMVKMHPKYQPIQRYFSYSITTTLSQFDRDFGNYKNNCAYMQDSISTLKLVNSKVDFQKYLENLYDDLIEDLSGFDPSDIFGFDFDDDLEDFASKAHSKSKKKKSKK